MANELKCNPDISINFLQKFSPAGPWVLTAIWPKGIEGMPKGAKSVQTITFMPHQADACRSWVESRNNAGWNIYFMPNPPRQSMNKKAKKEDIKEVQYLYVDLDPRPDQPFETERASILALLTVTLPDAIPQPTVIIDSGGGYWGLWKLEQPINLENDND